MVSVLLEAMGAKIPVLPVHDAVIVPDHLAGTMETIMKRVFREHMKQPITVDVVTLQDLQSSAPGLVP